MNDRNDEVYFDALGTNAQGLVNVLKERYNLPSRVENNCVFIKRSLLTKRFGARTYLSRHHQISIESTVKDKQVSSELASFVNMPQPNLKRSKISIPRDLGLITDTVHALNTLTVCETDAVAAVLSQLVLPLLRKFKATHVTCVRAELEDFQISLSIIRIICLWQRFGGDVAGQMIQKGYEEPLLAPFGHAWPNSMDSLSYVDALTKFPPIALTLPVRRLNCAFHFQSEAMWNLHRVYFNGWLNEFALAVNPLAVAGHYFGLSGLHGMKESNIWRFLSFVVSGVNGLLCWLSNPANFAARDGRIDLLRQVQALSAIHLLFGDLSAMHHSSESHHTISFAMSLLDKLSNIRVQLGGSKEPSLEKDEFKNLFSMKQAFKLKAILGAGFQKKGYAELSAAFENAVDNSYKELHDCLRSQGLDEEKDRLDQLWSQRNIRHGSFLTRNQFEKLFLTSSGAIPATIGSVAYLLVLGLVAAPEQFLAD